MGPLLRDETSLGGGKSLEMLTTANQHEFMRMLTPEENGVAFRPTSSLLREHAFMSSHEFRNLLEEFGKLSSELGSQSFDLCLHYLPGHDFGIANGCDLVWPMSADDEVPFDTEHRIGFAKLCRSFYGPQAARFGWVTLPRGDSIEQPVWVANEQSWVQPVPVWQRFRQLSEHAGRVLPPIVKDEMSKLWPPLGTEQAQRWYALLFHFHGRGDQSSDRADLTVSTPFVDSVDVIQRCRLNTETPIFSIPGDGSKSDQIGKHSEVAKQIRGTKRSTERGEGREKCIAALTKHHDYAGGSCLNQEPVGSNKLAQLAGVANSTASQFFKREFEGHTKYRGLCRDNKALIAALKILNQEYSPHVLYGGTPPGEETYDDE